ncbi:MAG: DotA/TraY family protein [Desulfosalsimonas sp.]
MPTREEEVREVLDQGPGPGPQDKAAEMLSELFGEEWWEILWSGQEISGDASLIIPALHVFNVVMVVAVSLILLYVVGHAFVGSAHEGTPLGRRLHSIWVPVRSVLSISLLAPIPWATALNFVQGVVLCFVGFSIQFANMAVDAGMEYISENQGQIVAAVPENLGDSGDEIAEVALNNYLIQYHQYWFQKNNSLVSGYDKEVFRPYKQLASTLKKRARRTKGYARIEYNFRNPEPFSENVMGGITVRCKEGDSALCEARQTAVENLLIQMEDVASRKVEELFGEDTAPPSHQEVALNIDNYGRTIMDAAQQMIDAENPELRQELDRFTDQIAKEGFAVLGSYYWTMSRFSTALQDQINAHVSTDDYNKILLKKQVVSEFNEIETNLEAINSYFRDVDVEYARETAEMGDGRIAESDTNLVDAGDLWKKVWGLLSKPFKWLTDTFITSISHTDPISALSWWGHALMNLMYGTIAALTGILLGGDAASNIPWIGEAISSVLNGSAARVVTTVMLFTIAPLFLLGFTLAYYLPSVPFIIWMISLFGWIIMVLEAMVAAPIWAAMHASPDGEGIAGDKGAQGYVIFAQILLRPVLMVVGFFFAMLMMHVISYAGDMFSIFFHGLSSNENFAGPITMVAGIFLGSVIIVILTHKSFHLVFILPDRIADWMGGVGVSKMGEGADVSESKRSIVGGAAIAAPTPHASGAAVKAGQSVGGGQEGQKGGQGAGSAELSSSAQQSTDDFQSGESGPAE